MRYSCRKLDTVKAKALHFFVETVDSLKELTDGQSETTETKIRNITHCNIVVLFLIIPLFLECHTGVEDKMQKHL